MGEEGEAVALEPKTVIWRVKKTVPARAAKRIRMIKIYLNVDTIPLYMIYVV